MKLQSADTAVKSLDGPRDLQQGAREYRPTAMERAAIVFVSFVSVLAVVNSLETGVTSCFANLPSSDADFLVCQFCASPRFSAFLRLQTWCDSNSSDIEPMATALLTYSEKIHGLYWRNNTSAALALSHLLRYMPKRDTLQLFGGSDTFLVDFILEEHVRLALDVREGGGVMWAKEIPEEIWLDYVLPYAFLNEKRDVGYRWRTKFLRIFREDGRLYQTKTTTDAMKIVAELVPKISLDGTLCCQGCGLVLPDATITDFVPGQIISWVASSAPINMSPQQTVERGASCTGKGEPTGVLMSPSVGALVAPRALRRAFDRKCSPA